MGLSFSFLRFLTSGVERRILLVGLDAAGKTTILYKLKLNEVVTTIPTIGFNVENVQYRNLTFTMWDIGGQDKIRPLWRHYYDGSDAVIFVVDSNDRERVNTARDELHRMLAEPLLEDADLPNSMSAAELGDKLGLSSLRGREWYIQASCATTGDGIYHGLDWLAEALTKKR